MKTIRGRRIARCSCEAATVGGKNFDSLLRIIFPNFDVELRDIGEFLGVFNEVAEEPLFLDPLQVGGGDIDHSINPVPLVGEIPLNESVADFGRREHGDNGLPFDPGDQDGGPLLLAAFGVDVFPRHLALGTENHVVVMRVHISNDFATMNLQEKRYDS